MANAFGASRGSELRVAIKDAHALWRRLGVEPPLPPKTRNVEGSSGPSTKPEVADAAKRTMGKQKGVKGSGDAKDQGAGKRR